MIDLSALFHSWCHPAPLHTLEYWAPIGYLPL